MPKKNAEKVSKAKPVKKVTVPETEVPRVQIATKNKAFEMAAKTVEKDYPEAYHCYLWEEEKMQQHYFSSGSVSVDAAVGGRGLPKGRIIELWGSTGSGKTSLALDIAWHLQRETGGGVVFEDIEHKLDRSLLKTWRGGFIPELTRYEEPFSGEEAFGILERYVQSQGVCAIIMDSVSGLVSTDIIDADEDKNPIGHQARLITRFLPKIAGLASRTGVVLLFVNQVRAKIDVNPMSKGKARLTKTGGNALGHYVCISLLMEKNNSRLIKKGNTVTGHWSKVFVYKNHAGPTPFDSFELCLEYGKGFDTIAELVDRSISGGIFIPSGSWFIVGEDKIQGKDNLIEYVRERPEIQAQLWTEIKDMQAPTIVEPIALSPDTLIFNDLDEGIEVTLTEDLLSHEQA
jgi:recombination protein RecA